jgi:glycosyltransferase involved in cell wall biosynthesis
MRIGVSVVIPARNEAKHIDRCIEGIRVQEGVDGDVEILVVDNGSTDGTGEVARRMGVRVIEQGAGTVGSLRNAGARETRGEVIAFVDGDCVPGNGWLAAAISTLREKGAAAAGSYHDIPEDCGWIGRTAELIQEGKREFNASYIPSGNMFVLRKAFEGVGGFDERLETNEDVDLCQRLVKSGYSISIDPEIRCVHLGSPSRIGDMIRREVWHGKSTWEVFWKDLKGVRNLGIVAFSMANFLLLVLGLGATVHWIGGGSGMGALIAVLGFLGLNGFVAHRDWKRVRRKYPSIFCYVMLYGIARALGVVRWVLR